MGARYAKDNIYADVQEEGGVIRRKVAVKGKRVPAVWDRYVDDSDTTTDVTEAHELRLERRVESVTETAPNLPSTGDGSVATSDASSGDGPPDPTPEPFEGYGDLEVEEITARLAELSDDEVATVKAYEAEHEAHPDILGWEPSPEDPEPLEGYGDLNAKEIVAKLRDLPPEQVAAVKAYEARHDGRTTIANYEPPKS